MYIFLEVDWILVNPINKKPSPIEPFAFPGSQTNQNRAICPTAKNNPLFIFPFASNSLNLSAKNKYS